ncbi:5-formyltetrahydrofolate cyclo-ligase [Aliikangiella sp. IMCC44632]
MESAIEAQKQSIRNHIRKVRQSIKPQLNQQLANQLAQQVAQHSHYQRAKNIACYLSFDGEINTQPLIQQIFNNAKLCFLPKLKPLKPNRLWFMPYFNDQTLVKNRFNIWESALSVNHAIAVSKLDIIFAPLVAFDLSGNRLGMGGGFYDRSLQHLQGTAKKPRFYGLAFAQQEVASIPKQAWDYPLDGVFTPQGLVSFIE